MSVTITSMQSAVITQVKNTTWLARWCITQTQRVGSHPLPLRREWRRGRSVQRGAIWQWTQHSNRRMSL